MTMWIYACRACSILLGPREDVMVGGRYYHHDCAPTEDEATAAEDYWTDLAIDQRREERHV